MSKYTAVSRKKPSLPMQFLEKNGLLVGDVLDYGCGRGFDVEYYKIDGYDPNWFPVDITKKYDTITCNFVLNVVTEEVQDIIISKVKSLLKPYGKAYFTVRRDMRANYQGRGCMQRLVYLDMPIIHKNSGQWVMYVMLS